MMADIKRKVPNLRFKGFTDDWEQRKLGEVAKVTMGQSPSSKNYTDNPNDYVLVQGNADLKSNEISPRVWTKEVTKKVHKGEFIMTVRAPVGYLATANMDAVIGRGVAAIDGNKYLYYLLQTKLLDRTWEKLSSGSTFESISSNDIKNLEIKVTETEEEKLIAKLMDTVTYFVTLQQRKLALLKQLKKGLLQKLFADKDDKQPVLRFGGFSGDWEQQKFLKTIDSIIDYRGRTPKKLGLTWSNSGYLALSALNVKNGWINKSSADSHFGDQKLYDAWMKKTPLHKGQVVFTTEAPMGNVAQIPDKNKYILSQRTIAFVTKEILLDDFLAYFLATSKVQMRLKSLSTGGTAKGVSQKSLNYLHIIYPKLNEQYKISRLLKNVNNSISLQQRKLDKYQSIKKSLLQQMFI